MEGDIEETINLTGFLKAHLIIVWPDKGWTVFDVPPSWYSLWEVRPVYYVGG